MDEKILGYLVANNRATDDCLRGVQTALDTLIKQAKINKLQKYKNVILGGLMLVCFSRMGTLLVEVQKQNKKIAILEAKINDGDTVETKGE